MILSTHTILSSLSVFAGLLYLPWVFIPRFSLEKHNTKAHQVIHYGVALFFLSTLPVYIPYGRFLILLFYLELIFRMGILVLARFFPQKFPNIKSKWTDLSKIGDPKETRIQAHPFLQFTGRMGKASGFERIGSYGDYGFVGISQDDLLTSNKLRIACLGGSTTEYGYPKILEDLLNEKSRSPRFQTLNFGLSWWTTLHSLVNYVLNVREFKPQVIVIHHNVNDHKYRGYQNFRPDGAHAFVAWNYSGAPDRFLVHFSTLYRFLRFEIKSIAHRLRWYGEFPLEGDKYSQILQHQNKTYNYRPEELKLYRRNIETIIHLAKVEKSKVILTTMPFSKLYDEPHDQIAKAHMIETNDLIRKIAKEHELPLVDLAIIVSDDSLFRDLVHVSRQGDQLKAQEICRVILEITDSPVISEKELS